MKLGTAWVKYALLVATILALVTPIIANASSISPEQACAPEATVTVPAMLETPDDITVTIPATTFTTYYSTTTVTSGTTATTTTTQVPGLSAISTLSSSEVTSSTTTCSMGPGFPATFVFIGLTTVIILGVPLAIPEYPFGVIILAIFMIIAYGVIRRRT